MDSSWTIAGTCFKTPLRILCRAFWLSRSRWKARAIGYRQTIEQLRQELQETRANSRQLRQQLKDAREKIQVLSRRPDHPPTFPHLTHLHGHQFSAQMIALCCTLSLRIGFRAVPDVLRLVAEAFGMSLKIPSRDAVRNWSCRNGVAILQEASQADDWVWMIDHSVQLGKMFVLVVLGIRQSQLPVGRPLRREDMTPLAVMPTRSRDKQEVERQLAEVAKDFGTPLAVLSDGACELHEGAERLKSQGFRGPHLDDVKHKVSNLLKKKLGKDERFKAFSAKLGQTTASIQQTELDHLLPPRKKEKSRFMDFDRLIDWATMVQHQLAQADDEAPEKSTRLIEKLGWVRDFQEDLHCWRECRQLVGKVLKYAGEQGVFVGSTEILRQQLLECSSDTPLAGEIGEAIVSIYQANEDRLSAAGLGSLRLPCSTEVLESAFGSFKALQRHHGRGTFTSLLAMFPSLFDNCTAEQIVRRFGSVSNKTVQAWLANAGLKNSTQSRRRRAYAEVMAAA